jgi:hypothetical protein
MHAKFVQFGEVKIDDKTYAKDVIVDGGTVRKRKKKPSKAYKSRFGHTPLSVDEAIPWDCERLIVGTGAYGKLPIMDAVYQQAEEKGVALVAVPTPEACELLSEADLATTNAILHLTC